MCNRYISPGQTEIEQFWDTLPTDHELHWPSEIFPRAPGPFVRAAQDERELVVGQWALIPSFAKTPILKWQTNNARSEELEEKASFREPWRQSQRCIIPAWSFDEPCWETGKNVWWRFQRADGEPWALAGLWNRWLDHQTGEIIESYTMLTINADDHPLMRRMHKPKPDRPPHAQDKRSVIPIARGDVDQWLTATPQEASRLLRIPPSNVFDAQPLMRLSAGSLDSSGSQKSPGEDKQPGLFD